MSFSKGRCQCTSCEEHYSTNPELEGGELLSHAKWVYQTSWRYHQRAKYPQQRHFLLLLQRERLPSHAWWAHSLHRHMLQGIHYSYNPQIRECRQFLWFFSHEKRNQPYSFHTRPTHIFFGKQSSQNIWSLASTHPEIMPPLISLLRW